MSKYHYEKLNLSDYKSTSYEDQDINDEYFDNNHNNINNNIKLNKKIKIKYIYIHYTNYPFYKKMSK